MYTAAPDLTPQRSVWTVHLPFWRTVGICCIPVMKRKHDNQIMRTSLATLVVLLPFSDISSADTEPGFTLNYGPHPTSDRGYITTDINQWKIIGCCTKVNVVVGGQSPFLLEPSYYGNGAESWELPEIVTVNNIDYYHMVIGSEAEGFIQESYIQTGYTMDFNGLPSPQGNVVRGWPYIWAPTISADNWGSASAGDYYVELPFAGGGGEATISGNANNPLGPYAISGNGSGNPNRTLIRQWVGDEEMSQEFLKERLLYKPKISQSIITATIEMHTNIDMSAITYDDDLSNALILNTLRLTGTDAPAPIWSTFGAAAPPDAADFNMADDIQNSTVSAGRYIFTPGSDTLNSPGGAEGVYSYSDGGFDVETVEWEWYFNADDISGNPWAYPDLRPQ